MPLKLIPPRPSNPNWQIRGSYLHVKRLYRSSGTPDERVAKKILRKIEEEIERGAITSGEKPKTFSTAALNYLRAGGEGRFIKALSDYFQDMPINKIDQDAIDKAAHTIFPDGNKATWNRQIYTPVSAILKYAGIDKPLKRPKGARGKLRLHWLQPDDAFKLLEACGKVDGSAERNEHGLFRKPTALKPSPHFEALCTFLLYCGCRLSEGLRLHWNDVDLANSFAYVRDTKNGNPRPVFLPPIVVAALANLDHKSETVFGYTKGRLLYVMLDRASKLSGVPIPDGISFHILRHSYGALMRRYGGLDTSGLIATGAWKSADAARVYEHVEFTEEAKKAALIPTAKKKTNHD